MINRLLFLFFRRWCHSHLGMVIVREVLFFAEIWQGCSPPPGYIWLLTWAAAPLVALCERFS